MLYADMHTSILFNTLIWRWKDVPLMNFGTSLFGLRASGFPFILGVDLPRFFLFGFCLDNRKVKKTTAYKRPSSPCSPLLQKALACCCRQAGCLNGRHA